jgi:hypothetical protein
MKKFILISVLVGVMPLSLMAQDDDMYFVPKKTKIVTVTPQNTDSKANNYWSGSNRSVDEYNRFGKYLGGGIQEIKRDSNIVSIVTFDRGMRPDTLYVDSASAQKIINQIAEYQYTRSMSRWDGFYNPWFYDYYGWGPYYWRSRYWYAGGYYGRFYDPFYYTGWYDPWINPMYNGWYGPWMYEGWYDPWYGSYYGYYGYYNPWYYGYYSPWYYGPYYGPWYYPFYGYYPGVIHINNRGGVNSGGYAGQRTWNKPQYGSNSQGVFGRYNGNGASGQRTNTYTNRSSSNRAFGSFSRNGNNNYNNNNTRTYSPPASNSGSFGSYGGGSSSSSGGFGGGHVSGGGGGGHFGGGRR